MAKEFMKVFATVFVENGAHKVMLPDGHVISHLVQTVTDDGIDSATVTMRMVCNVVASKAEAIEKYNQ
ncbi:hypothetical protein [Flavobacterium sp.]|uniref:hypothetical protein n=1 Tax=Flavobacterium sp. TaxID=239 RepID=UPI0026075373|nr:hypothetical protein [Flavobacterium sp.]